MHGLVLDDIGRHRIALRHDMRRAVHVRTSQGHMPVRVVSSARVGVETLEVGLSVR